MVPHIRSHRVSTYSAHFTTFDDCNIVDRCVFQKIEFSIYLKRIHSNKLQSIRHSRVERHYHTHTQTERERERERERFSVVQRRTQCLGDVRADTHEAVRGGGSDDGPVYNVGRRRRRLTIWRMTVKTAIFGV